MSFHNQKWHILTIFFLFKKSFFVCKTVLLMLQMKTNVKKCLQFNIEIATTAWKNGKRQSKQNRKFFTLEISVDVNHLTFLHSISQQQSYQNKTMQMWSFKSAESNEKGSHLPPKYWCWENNFICMRSYKRNRTEYKKRKKMCELKTRISTKF